MQRGAEKNQAESALEAGTSWNPHISLKPAQEPHCFPTSLQSHHELLRNHVGLAGRKEQVNYILFYPLNLKYYAQAQTAIAFHLSWL